MNNTEERQSPSIDLFDPNLSPKPPHSSTLIHEPNHPQESQDSELTKAEKYERHNLSDTENESSSKRVRLDTSLQEIKGHGPTKSERQKGVAPVKAEFVFSMLHQLLPRLTSNQVPSIPAR